MAPKVSSDNMLEIPCYTKKAVIPIPGVEPIKDMLGLGTGVEVLC